MDTKPKKSEFHNKNVCTARQYHKKHKKVEVVPFTLGPEQKKVLVTFPDLDFYKRKILARRLLYFNYKIGLNPPLRPRPNVTKYDFSWCNREPDAEERKYERLLPLKMVVPEPDDASRANLQNKRKGPETSEEFLQRKKFARRIKEDMTSAEFREVIINKRSAAITRRDLDTNAATFTSRQTIYLETLRAAMNHHDWVLVCKAIEGLADEVFNFHLMWSIFTGGLIAIANLYPNNMARIKEFTEASKRFFLTYQPRIGIEIATWMTQKGAFLDGYNFLRGKVEENHTSMYRTEQWTDNPKRKMFEYIVSVFDAVYHYSCYKRAMMNSGQEEEVNQISNGIQQLGYIALGHFERLLQLTEEYEFDVTIFIEPLIELLIRFKTKQRAKEVLEQVCGRYFGNIFLEELYLNFLRTHFPRLRKTIKRREKAFRRFQFEINPKEVIYHERILKRYLERKSTDNTQVPLKRIPNPSFCL